MGLFTTEQGDHPDRGYVVEVGVCFYLEVRLRVTSRVMYDPRKVINCIPLYQVIAALFCVILMLLTIGEFTFTKREQERFGRLEQSRNGKGGELDLNEDGMTDSNSKYGRHKTRGLSKFTLSI